MIGRREGVISIDRLKPAHVDLTQPVLVAQPRRRGRPHITQNQELFTDRYAPLQSNQETIRSSSIQRCQHWGESCVVYTLPGVLADCADSDS